MSDFASIQDAISFLDGDKAHGYIGIIDDDFCDGCLTAKGRQLFRQFGGKCRRDRTINLKKHANIKAFLQVADQGEHDEACSIAFVPEDLAKYWSVDEGDIHEEAHIIDLLLNDRSIDSKQKAMDVSRKMQDKIYRITIPHADSSWGVE